MSHFADKELSCRCCKKLYLGNGFRDKLEQLRIVFGKPMIVNCCYRCPKHNEDVGGAKHSKHMDGIAIDVHCPDGNDKGELIALAWSLGWTVGVYKTFLHLDRRKDEGEKQIVFYG